MRYYLSPWTGDGTPDTNPFTVRGSDQPGCRLIDLRPDSSVAAGFAICVADTLPAGAGVRDLGDSLDVRSTAMKNVLESRLGLTFDAVDTIRDCLIDILIVHARNDGTRWRPLKRTRRGGFEIFLGEQIYRQKPISGGSSYSESWNCGDNASLTCDLTWTQFLGTALSLTSNQCKLDRATGVQSARAEHDTATDDQRVQATLSAWVYAGNTHFFGLIGRKDSTATDTYYSWRPIRITTGSIDEHRLVKCVAAAESTLATAADDVVVGEVLRLDMDGSSIKGFLGGVEKAAVTDTAITANTRGGVRGNNSNNAGNLASLDDWSIADIEVAGGRTTKNTRAHPLGFAAGHPLRLGTAA